MESKKRKLDAASDASCNMDPEAILLRNQALMVDMADKRSKLRLLEKKCLQTYQDEQKSLQSYQIIKRHWSLLLMELQNMLPSSSSDDNNNTNAVLPPDFESSITLPSSLKLPDWIQVSKDKSSTEDSNKPLDGAGTDDDADEENIVRKIDDDMILAMGQAKTILSLVLAKTTVAQQQSIEKWRVDANELLSTKDKLHRSEKKVKTLERDIAALESARHKSVRDLERFRLDTNGKGGKMIEEEKQLVSPKSSPEKKEDASEVEAQTKDVAATAAVASAADKEQIATLEEKCKDLTENLERAQKSLTEATTQNPFEAAHLKVVEQMNAENARLCHALDQGRAEKAAVVAERDSVMASAKQLEIKYTREWSEKVTAAHDALSGSQASINDLQLEVSRLQNFLAGVESKDDTVKELSTLKTGLDAEIKALKGQCERAEERGRKAQKAKSQTFIDGLSTKAKNLETENLALKKSIDTLRQSLHESASLDEKFKKVLDEKLSAEKLHNEVKAKVQRREATIAKLTNDLVEAKANSSGEEAAGLISEIEAIISQLDSLQEQNANIIESNQKLKDSKRNLLEKNSTLNTEKGLLSEELAGLRNSVTKAQEAVAQQKKLFEDLEVTYKATLDEVKQLRSSMTVMLRDVELNRSMTMNARNEGLVLKKRVEVLSAPCSGCVEWERKDTERMEKQKKARLASSTTGPISDVDRYELDSLRKAIKCSVCMDREKNIILTTCFHMFCNECIDNTIKSRNRKCPTCKKGFDKFDVKSAWLKN